MKKMKKSLIYILLIPIFGFSQSTPDLNQVLSAGRKADVTGTVLTNGGSTAIDINNRVLYDASGGGFYWNTGTYLDDGGFGTSVLKSRTLNNTAGTIILDWGNRLFKIGAWSYDASYAPYSGQQVPDAAWVIANFAASGSTSQWTTATSPTTAITYTTGAVGVNTNTVTSTLQVTGGSVSDGAASQFFNVTGTLNSTNTVNSPIGVLFSITAPTGTVSINEEQALQVTLSGAPTGIFGAAVSVANGCTGNISTTAYAPTGTKATGMIGNIGIWSQAQGTNTGDNYAIGGRAWGGAVNHGVMGIATKADANINFGLHGTGYSASGLYAGAFVQTSSVVPTWANYTSAAEIVDPLGDNIDEARWYKSGTLVANLTNAGTFSCAVLVSPSSTLTNATLVTPALGTPASGNLTNCSNFPTAVTTQTVSSSYSVAITDGGTQLYCTASSAATVYLPSNSTAAIPLWTPIVIIEGGNGAITIAAGAGATVTSAIGATIITNTIYSVAMAEKTGTNTWLVCGDIIP